MREQFTWRQLDLYIERRNERIERMNEAAGATEKPQQTTQSWSTRWALAHQNGEVTRIVGSPDVH